ncbi:MAG: 3-oxoadipate enol-lactonase [Massilia sp.]|jgi:3-oxoadipate enol-lactonase|nr:3-oxoadipate enol-lactonase [Massilia sp.]
MEERCVTSFDGAQLYCRIDGNPAKPTILFANSLCCTVQMWDAQVEQLSQDYHLVRYDYRGHGRSPATGNACTLEMLARDALAILDALGIDQVNYVGLSLGGLIGMHLAVHYPARLKRIVLSNTSPHMPSAEKWNERMRQATEAGMDGIALNSFQRWTTPQFQAHHPDIFQALVQQARAIPPQGYANLCAALRDADMRVQLGRIDKPTLVIGSTADVSPLDKTSHWSGAIASAKLHIIEDAGHLSNLDQPSAFTKKISDFFRQG